VNVSPKIDILSDDETIETLYFFNREIKSQERIELKKILDTRGYNPGVYRALAIVDYGRLAKSESRFNIGELIIHLVNYTKQVEIGGINSFDIEIESGWNNKIDGAYAEVFISNSSVDLFSFKTSSTSLEPWEKKQLLDFLIQVISQKDFTTRILLLFIMEKMLGKVQAN